MLKSIGLYDQISKQGYNYEDITFVSARNLSTIGTVKNGSEELFGSKAVRVQRYIVRQTLLSELEKQGIDIRYGSKCVDVQEDTVSSQDSSRGPVAITLSDGTVEHGDIVVGTDGIHSRVRAYLDPQGQSNPIFSGQMGIGGTIQRAQIAQSIAGMNLPSLILGRDNSFMLMPTNFSGDEIGFFSTIETHDRSREEWDVILADQESMHKSLVERHSDPEHWPQVVIDVCRAAPVQNLSAWP